MKRFVQTTAAGLASLILVGVLGGAAPALAEPSAAPVLDPAGPLPGTVTVSHAQLEGLASDDAGELVLLTGDRDQDGLAAHLYATTRAADGTWGAPVELAAGHGSTQIAQIALAPDGSGVVSWNSYPGKYDVPDEVWAWQRYADGTWGPAQLLAHGENVYGPLQSVAAAGGNAAVAYLDDNYQGVVATPTASGWSTTNLPKDFGGPTIEMDDAGGLHAMVQSIPRGGGGDIWLTRKPAGAAHWTRPFVLKTPFESTDEAQLAVDAKGRESVLVGYVDHNGYRPPGDTETVGSTAYRLFAQRRPGGRLRTAWDRSGVGTAQLSQAGGRTRLTWEQWRGHRNRQAAQRILKSGVLAGPSTTLAHSTKGHFWFAATGGLAGAVSWLAPKGGPVLGATLRGGRHGTPVVLDDVAHEPDWRYLGQPATVVMVAGQPWVAWEHHFAEDKHGNLLDADVSLAPLA